MREYCRVVLTPHHHLTPRDVSVGADQLTTQQTSHGWQWHHSEENLQIIHNKSSVFPQSVISHKSMIYAARQVNYMPLYASILYLGVAQGCLLLIVHVVTTLNIFDDYISYDKGNPIQPWQTNDTRYILPVLSGKKKAHLYAGHRSYPLHPPKSCYKVPMDCE